MIQRIQTIFLLLASGAALSLFALPLATTSEAKADSVLFADAAFNIQDGPVMMGAFALAGLLLLVTIFLFNNRKLQMTLTKVGLLLTGVGIGVGAFYLSKDQAVDVAEPALGVALPLLVVIFAYLAHRYINKDEKLVRSVDRLR
jgi:peptidoglycan/LPS O-acetylase OafA/YrhL